MKLAFWKKQPPKKRSYQGASKNKRLSRWNPSQGSANEVIGMSIGMLRSRARELRRNNPHIAKGIQVITSNVVGKGIVTRIQDGDSKNVSPLEQTWKDWSNSTDCDFDGRHNLMGMQRLVMDAVAESGEILVRRRFDSSKKFPLQFQILECDFLDTNRSDGMIGEGRHIIQGIEFDAQGRRVAYYIFETHPGAVSGLGVSRNKSNRIPAEEIEHIYRQDRPGQARGVTWTAPVMIRAKDLDEYQDAQIMRQKIAACFTAFVRDISSDFVEDDDCEDLGDKIEPAMIEFLPPGKTIEFANPPSVENYGEFVKVNLQAIAAGLGITYEALTGDLSEVNFSAGRMGWLEFERNIEAWRKHIIESLFLTPIVKHFLFTAEIQGFKTENVKYTHIAPKRQMIDPTKEIPATIKAIRAGLTTLSDEIRATGKDPAEQLQQMKLDNELLDDLELKLDSDSRTKDSAGKDIEGETNDEENSTSEK